MGSETDKPLNLHGLLLVILVAGWLAGIVVGCWLSLPQFSWLILALLTLCLTGFFWRRFLFRVALLTILCLCLGGWRYATVSPVDDPQAIGTFISSQEVSIQGEIVDEPRLSSNSTLLSVATQRLSLDKQQTWQETHGEILVQIRGSTFDDPFGPHYGDNLQLTGRLDKPPFYATNEIQASMVFPGFFLKDRGGNPLLALLYNWRMALASILMQALPQPFAALLIALFLSLRTPSLKPILPFFTATGTAHLVAPSGFKVTLLASSITNGTRWLVASEHNQKRSLLPAQRRGSWRLWMRTILVILCIVLYTFLSGGGPSALRAGLMGILLALTPRLERSYNVYTSLAFAALLISLNDPFALWDAGFQLSFSGTLGIILFTPFFQHLLRFLKHLPFGEYFVEILSVTLAAQIATLPISMLAFNQVSFIAPLANLVSMPLLGVLIALGMLICLGGLIALPLALICGWLAWPLLWYMTTTISWCATLPGAYLQVEEPNPLIAWIYYALLAWLTLLLLTRWRAVSSARPDHSSLPFSQTRKHVVQAGVASLIILTTTILSLTTPSTGYTTLTLLTDNDSTQSKALLLHSPDGETALINEEANAVTLATTLDAHVPFWQRSLSLIILPGTSANNLSGLQDVIGRYQISQIIDPGMLHPSTAYARWRTTLEERHLLYTGVRQGAIISLGSQIRFQVLWPPPQLHKSSNEESDNALIVRMLAPGLRILFLNAAALSEYALKMLLTTLPPDYLHAEIVQLAGEENKVLPRSLSALLSLVHPSLLLITSTPARKNKNSPSSASSGTTLSTLAPHPWNVLQTKNVGSLEINSTAQGWDLRF